MAGSRLAPGPIGEAIMSLDMETAGNRLGKNQDLPAGMLWDSDTLCIHPRTGKFVSLVRGVDVGLIGTF